MADSKQESKNEKNSKEQPKKKSNITRGLFMAGAIIAGTVIAVASLPILPILIVALTIPKFREYLSKHLINKKLLPQEGDLPTNKFNSDKKRLNKGDGISNSENIHMNLPTGSSQVKNNDKKKGSKKKVSFAETEVNRQQNNSPSHQRL